MKYLLVLVILLFSDAVHAQSHVLISQIDRDPELGSRVRDWNCYYGDDDRIDSMQLEIFELGYLHVWRNWKHRDEYKKDYQNVLSGRLPFKALNIEPFQPFEQEILQKNQEGYDHVGLEEHVLPAEGVGYLYQYLWNGNAYDTSSIHEMRYDQTGRLTSDRAFGLDQGNWRSVWQTDYQRYYDYRGKLIATVSRLIYPDGYSLLQDSQSYRYHDNGSLSIAERLIWNGIDSFNSGQRLTFEGWHSYDSLRPLCDETSLYTGGEEYSKVSIESFGPLYPENTDQYSLQGTIEQLYDDQGRLIRREWKDAQQQLTKYKSLQYYPQGDLKEWFEISVGNDSLLAGEKYIISYDDRNRPISAIFCRFEPALFKRSYDSVAFYFLTYEPRSNVKVSTRQTLSISPNPAYSSIKLTGYEPGSNIEILSLSGVTQMTRRIEGDETSINIEGLPSGVYLVRSDNGASAMFVKR